MLGPDEEAAAKSFRNLRLVRVAGVDEVGIADVVGAAWLVLSDAAVERLTELGKREIRAGTAGVAGGEAA